jgi:hypothetical protein
MDNNVVLTESEAHVLVNLFRGPAGSEAADLLYEKYVNVSGFDPDPFVHAHNSGRRGLALLLVACANKSLEVVGNEHIDPSDSDNTGG